ncbi:caspase family protein [Mesorhizobium sp. M0757]|uniref:caspase family protein n=1 Tax=Mesorhizobium sp. M0757 TaxID=2956993 RepID=UPI003334C339
MDPAQAAPPDKPSNYMFEAMPRIHVIAFANGDYTQLDPLPSVAQDYRVIREAFSGSNSELHGDPASASFATRDDFWAVIRKVLPTISSGDVVFFYFSGHGFSYNGVTFLLPLDYPKTPVTAQELSSLAVPLYDVVAALQKPNPSALVIMLDSCRTGTTFLLSHGNATTPATSALAALPATETLDRRLPFQFKVLFPNRIGGEAIALSSADKASFFTQAFHDVALESVRMNDFDNKLKDRTVALTSRLPIVMQPVIEGNSFGFAPHPADADWSDLREEWEATIDKLSVESVQSYLRLYPVSQFGLAARKFLDTRKSGISQVFADGGGNQMSSAVDIDRGFEMANGGMVGVINSAFPIRHTRIVSQEAVASSEAYPDSTLGVVTGKNRQELLSKAAAQVKALGTKVAFDATKLEKFGEVSSPFDIDLLASDHSSAPVVTRLPKGVPFQIPELRLDRASGDLFAKVDLSANQSGMVLPEDQVALPDQLWAKFNASVPDPSPEGYTSILGFARSEIIVPQSGSDRPTRIAENVISHEVARLREASYAVQWVSIATPRIEDSHVDELRTRLAAEADVDKRRALMEELAPLEVSLQAQIDQRDLRALHARLALVKAGIPSAAIAIVNGRSGLAPFDTRLRFFTSR